MASEEVRGSFCRDDSCVITDQLATGPGALERELLPELSPPCAFWCGQAGSPLKVRTVCH